MCFMKNYNQPDIFITGLGVTCAIGQGKEAFTSALLQGRHAFGVMQRCGRQKGTSFLGAEIPSLECPERFSKRLLRTVSFSGQVAMITLHPRRIGLVIGGSNLQQRELIQTCETYADRVHFVRPTYGLSFMDS